MTSPEERLKAAITSRNRDVLTGAAELAAALDLLRRSCDFDVLLALCQRSDVQPLRWLIGRTSHLSELCRLVLEGAAVEDLYVCQHVAGPHVLRAAFDAGLDLRLFGAACDAASLGDDLLDVVEAASGRPV